MTGSGGAQSSLDRVYTALADGGFRPSRRATDFKALCPVHEERTGSLHVTWKAGTGHGGGGQVVLHCFGCNATAEAITERLGLSVADLYDEPLPPPEESSPRNPLSRVGRTARSRKQGTVRGKSGRLPARVVKRPQPPDEPQHRWEVTARYPYVDLEGTLVQEAWRRTCTSCPIPHKTFTQRYPDPRDGALADRQPPGWSPVLYRWPEVHAALLALQTVWVVEGEKDADNAAAVGVAATTNPNGGRAFPDPCAEALAGGTVHVVLDRDDTGWARGLRLHEQLSGVGCTVRLFLPATLDAKSDLSDHLQAGHTLEQLVEVSVAEVACWHYLEPVSTAVKGVEECRAEAVERLARAAAARDAEDAAAAEQESGYAARWATAAVVRWETLSDGVTRLAGAAQSAGTAWAAEAATVGVSLLRRAGKVVAEIHERAQLTLPAEVATHLLGPRAEQVVTAAPGQKATGRTDRRAPRTGGQYELTGGELWQRGERPRRLLNLDVQIDALEYAVDGGDDKLDQVPLQGRDSRAGITAVRNHRTATNVIFRWTSPLTGEVERERVELDAAKKSDWLADLSIPGLTYSSTSGGRAQVWDAIRSTSLDWTGEDLHDATGWHHFDKFGWGWIHAGGAITAKGNQPLGVVLEGRLGNFDLPDPVHDEVVVGAAFRSHTLPLLTRLPTRVTAPLVGHMMRAVLGRHPWTPVVIGPKGSIKTGVAALVQAFYGEAWDRDRPLASMSGNGDTDNALRQKLHRCKDAVGFLDDVAPTKDIPTAQAHMENVARTIHNNEERSRSTRDGQGMHGGRPPRGSAVITSEVWPAPGSGADRLMPLPITRNDIPLAAVLELDSADSRYGRAMLMSSLISWIAGDLPGLRQQMRSTVAAVAQRLRAAGRETRQAEAYAGAWSGWILLLDFLVDTEAITVAEASSIRQQVWAGLGQAMDAALDPDMPLTRGARLRELLAHALATGLVHVSDIHDGSTPAWPMGSRLGWRRVTSPGRAPNGDSERFEPRGTHIGWVNLRPRGGGPAEVCLVGPGLEQALKVAAGTVTGAPIVDRPTALRDLEDTGVLLRMPNGRYTTHRTVEAINGRPKVTVLLLDRLLGDDDPDSGFYEPPPNDPGPAPTPPSSTGPNPRALARPARPTDIHGTDTLAEDDAPPFDRTGVGVAEIGVAGPGAENPSDSAAGDADFVDDSSGEHPDENTAHATITEIPMHPAPTSTTSLSTHSNRAGLTTTFTHIQPAQPCLVCHGGAGQTFFGLPLHTRCFWDTTAATPETLRAALTAQPATGATTAAPAPEAAHDPATSGSLDTPPAADAAAVDKQPDTTATTPSSAPPPPPTETRPSAQPAVATLDVDGLWLPDGSRLEVPDPVRHLGDIAALAHHHRLTAQATRWHQEPATIVITAGYAKLVLRLPVDQLSQDPLERAEKFRQATASHPVLVDALAAGWEVDRRGLAGWTRVSRRDAPTVRVAFADLFPADLLGDDTPTPAQVARRLDLLATHLGYPFRVTGSATGIDLITGLHWNKREEYLAPSDPVPPALRPLEPDALWCRKPTPDEASRRYLHAFDRGGSYAAGASSLAVGYGTPTHHPDGTTPDPRLPGLWRVVVPEPADWRIPAPIVIGIPGMADERTGWITSPTLQLALDWDYDVQVAEAYTWTHHTRLFDSFYARIRDARTKLDTPDPDMQAARNLVKGVYTQTFGQMASPTLVRGEHPRGYAPERFWAVKAKARANLLRRVQQIGQDADQWPVAIDRDTIAYTSNDPDPVTAWPGDPKHLGRGLGQYKPERSGLLADAVPHLVGDPWKGKRHLIPVDDWNGGR